MTPQCPECGAALTAEGVEACVDLFHAALALEWDDIPHTYSAHHLLVATYMLQHPASLTPEAVASYEKGVMAIVDEGLTGEQLRQRNRGQMDQTQRSWNVRAATPAAPVLRHWSATIADVMPCAAAELPERIWQWARAVRDDLRSVGG